MIVDLFAGPGGWSEGLRTLGTSDLGIEHDADAAATRYAAGHATWIADLAAADPLTLADCGVTGLIGSPPCQSFSVAGKRGGLGDERGQLVWIPMLWALALRPEWVALEQVPQVLPIWKQVARRLSDTGYSTWTGILNSADFGVPQTRERAFLVARLGAPACPPEPTHSSNPHADTMFGPPLRAWVTMAEALGWDGPPGDAWPWTHPATTVAGDPRISARCHHYEGTQGRNAKSTAQVRAGDYEGTEPIRLTPEEATVLQSFRSDYPWQGTKTSRHLQIGNAVPPGMAAAVLRTVL